MINPQPQDIGRWVGQTGQLTVIAFPGGRGTAHMMDIAKGAGVKVIEVANEI